MGSSESGAVECEAGSIVWVRRRNGSWWPGKILGPEELPTSHLTSPRSGTPVKLLGREDASVDWYNLEKSKRVKAFRCGEFDDCIERAESAQGAPIKKREKYARREDAIHHALELEKELLRKQGKLGVASELARKKSSSSVNTEFDTFSRSMAGNPKSYQTLKRVDSSHKDEINGSSLFLQKPKDGNQPGWEEDHTDVIPRMRGLQDFGLRAGPLKRKPSSSGALDGYQKLTVEDESQAQSNGGPSTGRTSHENGEEQVGGIFRAKMSKCVHLPTGSGDTSEYKEAPPSQGETSPSQVEDGDSHLEENASEYMEDTESDSSESESDSSETEPYMDEEMTDDSGDALYTDNEPNGRGRFQTLEHGSMSTEESDESALSGYMFPHDSILANEAVSKWQLKGKRNIRNLRKRSLDASEGRGFNGYNFGTYHEEKRTAFGQRALRQSFHRNDDYADSLYETDMIEKDYGNQVVGLDNKGYHYTSRAASGGQNRFNPHMIDWEDRPALRGNWDRRFGDGRHFGSRTRSMLIDVDLKVQRSYQKAPVPIVSLVSRLDGKAIIGHPILIEALADGSSETLLPASGYFVHQVFDHDGNTALPPAWRTARRTSFRVPRPHPSSVVDSDDAANCQSFLGKERKPLLNELDVGSFGNKTILVRKSHPISPQSPMDKKFPRKLPKKANLSTSQKTRTLSSIGIEQNVNAKPIHDIDNCQIDGLIKSESSGPTTVACIPVKLVFSRILEKINRPPSRIASKVVLSNSDSERNPS
ncbi:hypothetical protein CFOL_v3_30374 [Cephalotus follicularis]|uniref:PWWP domain-containing protein n=1 Tax=Cephalotus follicularis TaxID=3775 RepID=A0A1Q3D3W0_CEPFO|nr:hypothetical protein CFOL_v3_30374 [Cephalotus follicularis]